jgi:hypothetical protein
MQTDVKFDKKNRPTFFRDVTPCSLVFGRIFCLRLQSYTLKMEENCESHKQSAVYHVMSLIRKVQDFRGAIKETQNDLRNVSFYCICLFA